MEKKKFILASPEVLNFLNLTEQDVAPEYQGERIKKFADRLSTGDGFEYENQLIKQGANPQAFQFLNDYIKFEPHWKNTASVQSINALTDIAQNNPNPTYSYSLKEGPLYRGTKLNTSPSVGDMIELSRFRSFSPDINIAGPFVNEGAPLDFSLNDEEFKKQLALENKKQKVLFQVQSNSPGEFNYLISPDTAELEVFSRPGAKYVVEAKNTFPFWQRGMTGDIDFIKLKQIYGVDPFGAIIEGGKNLIKQNPTGALLGASTSLMDPEVVKSIEKNRYDKAAGAFAKDVASGAIAEAGIKSAMPIAGKFVPGLAKAVAPIARLAGPVATGAALIGQGRTGSLTDVLAEKAANNPVSWLPAVKANPKTDIGAKASQAISNEARYAFGQLLKGRIPYLN